MGRRPPEDSWERRAQRRARATAGERSYPPAGPDEYAHPADAFAGETDDDDSLVVPAITLPTMRVPRQSAARPLEYDQRLRLPDEYDDPADWQGDDDPDEFDTVSRTAA